MELFFPDLNGTMVSTTIYIHCIWGDDREGANGYYRYYPDKDKINGYKAIDNDSDFYNYGYYYLNCAVRGRYGVPPSFGGITL